jgi:hypothetical protein
MKLPDRQFVTESADVAAAHVTKPLWFALFSTSGAGKTFTSLRLATGMQQVIGGDIHLIDTENGRGLHYKDFFKYQWTRFDAPFGSLDYLVAIQHAAKRGAKIIIVDQLSFEHDGEGGMIDYHDREVDRLAGEGSDWRKREAVKMLAWTAPKQARKQLIRSMLAMDVAFVLCFRADETAKPVKKDGKTEVVQMGFVPIGGKNFVYEATVAALLLPGAHGVPTWRPEGIGERAMVKLPEQFKNYFKDGEALSEDHGRRLAEWARAAATKSLTSPLTERFNAALASMKKAASVAKLEDTWSRAKDLRAELASSDPSLLNQLTLMYEGRQMELEAVAK